MRTTVLTGPTTRTRRRVAATTPDPLRRLFAWLRATAADRSHERREPIDKPFPFFGE